MKNKIVHAAMEKCRQEKALTKLNMTTSLKLDEVGSIFSGDSDSLDANTEADPEFVFPSDSSGDTGSTQLCS